RPRPRRGATTTTTTTTTDASVATTRTITGTTRITTTIETTTTTEPPPGWRLAAGVSLAALLLFVAGRCLVPMDETDLFFNLRLGEIVLGTHQVPLDNRLSFTWPDARDVNLA